MPRKSHPIPPPSPDADDLKFLRPMDVCALLGISRPTLWRLRRAGSFPHPTALSQRSIGWRRAEVEAWIASRAKVGSVAGEGQSVGLVRKGQQLQFALT